VSSGQLSRTTFVEAERVAHAPVGDARVHQDSHPLLERGGGQRHDHAARAEEIGELHIFNRSCSITSTGRRMIPIPAASNAASFSSAVPDEPEMMAPACPIRRPLGAV
jgi:hypothetical protein